MTYPCCGKSTGHASWCTSTLRMLAGEAVTYTTVTRHVWRVEWQYVHDTQYRWRCSCGQFGTWKTKPLQAEQGAKTHARRAK